MATIEINRGLRKVDFHSADGTGGGSSHASVEFVRETPLPSAAAVHIPLGMRDGRLRALIGVPQLLEQKGARPSSRHEYVYRIGGLISEDVAAPAAAELGRTDSATRQGTSSHRAGETT